MKHTCSKNRACTCSCQALEPSEDCPIHGCPWPPRCQTCGRFIRHENSLKGLTPGRHMTLGDRNFTRWMWAGDTLDYDYMLTYEWEMLFEYFTVE